MFLQPENQLQHKRLATLCSIFQLSNQFSVKSMSDLRRSYTSGSLAGSTMSTVTMPDLPNLPGVRRDLSLINPKLYREYKASLAKNAPQEEQFVEEENSLMSFFEGGASKAQEFSQILSPYPHNGGSYNDISGRYSLVSQQQDRLRKSRSLPYTNTNNLPSYITNEGRVCSFIAYFTEIPREGVENRSRMVFIKLYMEDNSIEMLEPRVENSGTTQGKFLKRHQVFKPNSRDLYTIQDFTCGAEVDIYNRIYTVIDCDNGTKKFLEARGLPFGTPLPLPETMYDPKSRAGVSRAPPRTSTRESKSKNYFLYDTKVLRFFGVWDCRGMLFGDEINVKVHYSLAENTIEVVPINGRNTGRDRLPKLLKKTSIMKPAGPALSADEFDFAPGGSLSPSLGDRSPSGQRSASPSRINTASTQGGGAMTLNSLAQQEKLRPNVPYHWTDLKVGLTIPVAAMTLLLVDADEFTREFYSSKNMPLDPPISRPEPQYPALVTTIPPYNGFGSEEDSLQTCKQTLVLSAPSKDGAKLKQLAGMILRYEAILANPEEVDAQRKFIIQVHLEDDTFQIREPPIRNSGHKGGIFLSRCKLETHDGSKPLQPGDIFLGGEVEILSHRFKVLNCDQFTFKFMEENCKTWTHSNLANILAKVVPRKEVIQRILLTYPGLSSRFMDVEECHALLEKAGLQVSKQEACTLFRTVDVTFVGSVKMTQFLKHIMNLR